MHRRDDTRAADRRAQIAEAGIQILASRGVRALTHLSVDRNLGLAEGSTSYYARTRRDLIALIVDNLARRTTDELIAQTDTPECSTPAEFAQLVVAGLDATTIRADEHRARLVLLLECQNDPELRASLVTRPEVRDMFIKMATGVLDRMGVDNPEFHAQDFAGLVDSLLMQRVIRTGPINEEDVITAYLTGLKGSA